jgi:hypothetical protein
MSMIKVILVMYMCSTVSGNECRVIPTPKEEFPDVFECTRHGYVYSNDIMKTLTREFVNKYGAHTRFTCQNQKII